MRRDHRSHDGRRSRNRGQGHRRSRLPMTIATAPSQRRVRVVRVEGGRHLVRRLAALGIVPGASIAVDRSSRPALVTVGHTRIAVGRGVAVAVEVEEEQL